MSGPGADATTTSTGRLRELWAADRPAFGLWSSLADPVVAEVVGATAFDYVCVDLQHGTATWADAVPVLQAMRLAGRAPVVRVPWNEPAGIMRALDTGACAVLVPMVDDGLAAAEAVASSRFPPAGRRSWGPMWGGARPDAALLPAQQDERSLCLVMVETRAAVDALEEIAGTPGLDGIYIGPNDLALGCGYGRATYRDSPEVDALLQRIVDACRAAGIVAGLHCSDVAMALHWAQRGARMLTVAQDTALLRAAADATWAGLAAGRAGRPGGEVEVVSAPGY